MIGKPVMLISEHQVTEHFVGQVLEQLTYGGFETIKVFSQPVARASFKYKLANIILSSIISITGSHHQVESTVFCLIQIEESHSANSKT